MPIDQLIKKMAVTHHEYVIFERKYTKVERVDITLHLALVCERGTVLIYVMKPKFPAKHRIRTKKMTNHVAVAT